MIASTRRTDFGNQYLDWLCASCRCRRRAIGAFAAYSGHTEGIVASDVAVVRAFRSGIDAAAIAVNASTRFTDGGQLGLGAEVGISTQKLHARGPMGLAG